MKLLLLALAFGLALGALAVGVERHDPPTSMCPYISHPKYECGTPIWCFDDWPHATKNFVGDPRDPIAENNKNWYYLLGGKIDYEVPGDIFPDVKPNRKEDDHLISPVSHLNDTTVHAEIDVEGGEVKQCCRPTVECYNHVLTAPRVAWGHDVWLEDFDDWQKAMCCIFEFTKPRPDCRKADSQLPIRWDVPPYCSNQQSFWYKPETGERLQD